jgi:uncharacterized phage protein (TIGR01671 family)
MREIKFRVWDNVDYMSSPFTLHGLMFSEIEFTTDCPIMQYTGLKDKNGKEIYEGDILTDGERRFKIEYLDAILQFKITIITNEIKEWQKIWEMSSFSNCAKLEIIGNIYENQSLLNSQS